MTEILISVGLYTAIVMLLMGLIVQAKRRLIPSGDVEIVVNEQKKFKVKPGGKLSLQSHRHRSEHWIVVAGTAEVTIGEDTQLVTENQGVYIPLGEKHRMANPGKLPMYLIEVQTGAYLGEDDIIRYEDIYDRS